MKGVVLHQYGGPEELRYEETPRPEFGDNEVLVRVKATSVNPIDFKLRSGTYKARMPVDFPAVPGARSCRGSGGSGAIGHRLS
jgi:NADPH:quinone reductase-like Zn-dependent oxidoreductase